MDDRYLWPAENVLSMLLQCDKLSSVTLNMGDLHHPLLIARLAEHCAARLEVLNVGEAGVNDEDVAAIAEHCPNLRVLNMHHLSNCSNYELLLEKCAKLEKLRVASHHTYFNSHQPTHNSAALLTAIATHCKHIHHLSFLTNTFRSCTVHPLLCLHKLRVFETSCYHFSVSIGNQLKGVEVKHFRPDWRNEKDFSLQ